MIGHLIDHSRAVAKKGDMDVDQKAHAESQIRQQPGLVDGHHRRQLRGSRHAIVISKPLGDPRTEIAQPV